MRFLDLLDPSRWYKTLAYTVSISVSIHTVCLFPVYSFISHTVSHTRPHGDGGIRGVGWDSYWHWYLTSKSDMELSGWGHFWNFDLRQCLRLRPKILGCHITVSHLGVFTSIVDGVLMSSLCIFICLNRSCDWLHDESHGPSHPMPT